MTDQANDKLDKLIDMASEVTGVAVAGAVIGYLKPGPEAAAAFSVAGVGLNHVLRTVAMDMKDRFLGRREEVRIGATVVFAAEKIRQNIENGQQIRQDGFFQEQPGVRADAEEIVEGVLLAAQREHEEKKLRFLSNILANVAFMPEVSAAQANWLLQKAQELTYRQLCIIALTERKDHKNPSWGPSDGDPAFEMEYKQLMDMVAYEETLEDYERGHLSGVGELSPVFGLNRIGKLCYTVMGLNEIPEDDLWKLALHFPRAFE